MWNEELRISCLEKLGHFLSDYLIIKNVMEMSTSKRRLTLFQYEDVTKKTPKDHKRSAIYCDGKEYNVCATYIRQTRL